MDGEVSYVRGVIGSAPRPIGSRHLDFMRYGVLRMSSVKRGHPNCTDVGRAAGYCYVRA